MSTPLRRAKRELGAQWDTMSGDDRVAYLKRMSAVAPAGSPRVFVPRPPPPQGGSLPVEGRMAQARALLQQRRAVVPPRPVPRPPPPQSAETDPGPPPTPPASPTPRAQAPEPPTSEPTPPAEQSVVVARPPPTPMPPPTAAPSVAPAPGPFTAVGGPVQWESGWTTLAPPRQYRALEDVCGEVNGKRVPKDPTAQYAADAIVECTLEKRVTLDSGIAVLFLRRPGMTHCVRNRAIGDARRLVLDDATVDIEAMWRSLDPKGEGETTASRWAKYIMQSSTGAIDAAELMHAVVADDTLAHITKAEFVAALGKYTAEQLAANFHLTNAVRDKQEYMDVLWRRMRGPAPSAIASAHAPLETACDFLTFKSTNAIDRTVLVAEIKKWVERRGSASPQRISWSDFVGALSQYSIKELQENFEGDFGDGAEEEDGAAGDAETEGVPAALDIAPLPFSTDLAEREWTCATCNASNEPGLALCLECSVPRQTRGAELAELYISPVRDEGSYFDAFDAEVAAALALASGVEERNGAELHGLTAVLADFTRLGGSAAIACTESRESFTVGICERDVIIPVCVDGSNVSQLYAKVFDGVKRKLGIHGSEARAWSEVCAASTTWKPAFQWKNTLKVRAGPGRAAKATGLRIPIGTSVEIVDRVEDTSKEGTAVGYLKLAGGRGWVPEINKKTRKPFFIPADIGAGSAGSHTVTPPHGALHGYDPAEAWRGIGGGSNFEHVYKYVHHPTDDEVSKRKSAFSAMFGETVSPRVGHAVASGLDLMGALVGGTVKAAGVERNRAAQHKWFTEHVFSKQKRFGARKVVFACTASSAVTVARRIVEAAKRSPDEPYALLDGTYLLVVEDHLVTCGTEPKNVIFGADQTQLLDAYRALASLLCPVVVPANHVKITITPPQWATQFDAKLDIASLLARPLAPSCVVFINTSGGVQGIKTAPKLSATTTSDQVLPGAQIVIDRTKACTMKIGGAKVTFLHLADGRGWVLANFGENRIFFSLDPRAACFTATRYERVPESALPVRRNHRGSIMQMPPPELTQPEMPPPEDLSLPDLPPPELPPPELPPPELPLPKELPLPELQPPPPLPAAAGARVNRHGSIAVNVAPLLPPRPPPLPPREEEWSAEAPPASAPPVAPLPTLFAPLDMPPNAMKSMLELQKQSTLTVAVMALPKLIVPPCADAALLVARDKAALIELPTFDFAEWLNVWVAHQQELRAQVDTLPDFRMKMRMVDAAMRGRAGMGDGDASAPQNLGLLCAGSDFGSYLEISPFDVLVEERKKLAALLASFPEAARANADEAGPLLWSAAGANGGNASDVSIAIATGCDVDYRDERTDTTILHRAIVTGNIGVALGLIVAGCDPNLRSGGVAPLHTACSMGRGNIVVALLMAGADVTATTRGDSSTALHVVCDRGDASVAKLLLDNGALRTAARMPSAECALHIAARSDDVLLASIILGSWVGSTLEVSWQDQLHMLSAPMRNGENVLGMQLSSTFRNALERTLSGVSSDGAGTSFQTDVVPLRALSAMQVYALLNFLGLKPVGAALRREGVDGEMLASISLDAAVSMIATHGAQRESTTQLRARAQQLVHAVRSFDRTGAPLVAVSRPVVDDVQAVQSGDTTAMPAVCALHECVGRNGLRTVLAALFRAAGGAAGTLTRGEFVASIVEVVMMTDVWSPERAARVTASFGAVFDAVGPPVVAETKVVDASGWHYGTDVAAKFKPLAGSIIALALGARGADNSSSATAALLFEVFAGNNAVVSEPGVAALVRSILLGFGLRGLVDTANSDILRETALDIAAACCDQAPCNDVYSRWVHAGGGGEKQRVVPFREWQAFWASSPALFSYVARALALPLRTSAANVTPPLSEKAKRPAISSLY